MLGMFVVGSVVLVLECVVQSWWVREYEGMEAAAEAAEKRKRMSRRTARVRVESVVEYSGEMDERMKSKCGQCVMDEVEA